MVSHAVQDKMAVEKMKTVIIYKHWKENRLESVTKEGIVSGEYFNMGKKKGIFVSGGDSLEIEKLKETMKDHQVRLEALEVGICAVGKIGNLQYHLRTEIFLVS